MKINKVLEKIVANLATRPEILFAYLYGSYAKGTATPQSDVDICLVLDDQKLPPDLYDYMFKIQEELTEIAGGPEIEAIPRQVMSYPLYYTSILYGKPIYSKEGCNRINFESRVFDDYFDIKPLYDARYNKIMKGLYEKKRGQNR